MSQHAAELCSLLVDETYGELTSRIFTILQRRGRLTIRLLQEHTQLNPRQLRHGLAVLIQQNLLYYFYEADTKETFYEANQDAAYWLLRSGKILEVAEENCGSVGLELVRDLHLLGQAKVSDLINDGDPGQPQVNGKGNGHHVVNGLNGDTNGHRVTGRRANILAQLFEIGLVERVRKKVFRSPTDTRNEIEKGILKESFGGSTKGTKQKEELIIRVRDELRSLRSEGEQILPRTHKKRAFAGRNEANGNAKRRRLSHSEFSVNDNDEYEGVGLDGDLLLRINYEKFAVVLRNNRVAELACDRIGETTSRVYAGVLRLIEDRIPRCQLDVRIDDVDDRANGPSVSTTELFAALGDTVNVAAGIGKSKRDTHTPRKEIPAKEENVHLDFDVDAEENARHDERKRENEKPDMNGDGEVLEVGQDSDSDEDPIVEQSVVKGQKRPKVTFEVEPEYTREDRLAQLKKHLELLAADECRFLRRCGQNEWTVDFQGLVDYLKESEVNSILLENFGPLGHRLIRMMRKYGKLDEKVLPQTALTTQKEIRTKLAEMQMAGIVEVQCIPRDAAHTVNRSIYLWFFDAERVMSMLLNSIYKTMTRCIQRLEIERRKASDILSLAGRSDVRENESEVLTAEQMNRLQNFRDKEEMLLGQAVRLDVLVGIFRDY